MIRQAFVILTSLVTFVTPSIVALGFWSLEGGMDPEVRSLGSVFVWVVAFAFSTQIFWTLVQRTLGRDGQ